MEAKIKVTHTPTPWICGEDMRFKALKIYAPSRPEEICMSRYGSDEDKENLQFIVRACNAHDALVQACKLSLVALLNGCPEDNPSSALHGLDFRAYESLKTAIALAKEKV